jgi:hypothetical protein
MPSNAPGLRHLWVTGPTLAVRAGALGGLDLPPRLASIDAHRRLRGPYTFGGALARLVAPRLVAESPEVADRHGVELLAVAPELARILRPTGEAPTRSYPAERTVRLAHGLTEVLSEHAAGRAVRPASLVIENAHWADPTDLELLAILLRRLDPSLVTLVVGTSPQFTEAPLGQALDRFARRIEAPVTTTPGRVVDRRRSDDARRYVWSDGTSDQLELRAAYVSTAPDVRAGLHDERAGELEATGEPTLRLGAVPYHLERGSDPHGAGADALAWAAAYCTRLGYYHAARELGYRAAALLDWDADPEAAWTVTELLAVACVRLGLADEAGALYDGACTRSTAARVHLHAAYGRAVLYGRHHQPVRRDLDRARMWLNTAIALSSLLPPGDGQTVPPMLGEDGLALLAQQLSEPEAALRVVDDGLERLDAGPEPDRHAAHRSVLEHNRAQLLDGLGRLDEAVESYSRAIDADPDDAELRLARAGAYRRLGQHERAHADYTDALRRSPPHAEAYCGRADVALELGDLDEALGDYSRAVELRPDLAPAWRGLGRVHLARGWFDLAVHCFDTSLDLDDDPPTRADRDRAARQAQCTEAPAFTQPGTLVPSAAT